MVYQAEVKNRIFTTSVLPRHRLALGKKWVDETCKEIPWANYVVELEYMHLGHGVAWKDIGIEFQKRDLRPATVYELAAFDESYPEERCSHEIAALGSGFDVERGPGRALLRFDGIRFIWIGYGWHTYIRFLAARKQQKLESIINLENILETCSFDGSGIVFEAIQISDRVAEYDVKFVFENLGLRAATHEELKVYAERCRGRNDGRKVVALGSRMSREGVSGLSWAYMLINGEICELHSLECSPYELFDKDWYFLAVHI